MYYYLIVVKQMYINEPVDPSPIGISGPMKAVIYVGLAGTLTIGIYPQPFTDWVVSATLMFANFIGPSATVIPPGPPLGG
jgi:NADH-quinone oxidoreductase subunit N